MPFEKEPNVDGRDRPSGVRTRLSDPSDALPGVHGGPVEAGDRPVGVHGRLDDREAIAKRAPRYALKVPVRFSSADGLVLGETVDISASGMLVMFDRPMDVWLTGELSTYVHAHPLKLRVRVIRSDHRRTAVSFQIRTDEDRAAVSELMVVATEQGEFVAPTP